MPQTLIVALSLLNLVSLWAAWVFVVPSLSRRLCQRSWIQYNEAHGQSLHDPVLHSVTTTSPYVHTNVMNVETISLQCGSASNTLPSSILMHVTQVCWSSPRHSSGVVGEDSSGQEESLSSQGRGWRRSGEGTKKGEKKWTLFVCRLSFCFS